MTFVIKIDRLGNKVEVRGLAVGADTIHRVERSVRDLVKSSSLPFRIPLAADGTEDRTDLAENLSALFTSSEALDSFVDDIKVSIVQRLIPKMQIEGYSETEAPDDRDAARNADEEARRSAGHPRQPPAPLPGIPGAFSPWAPRPGQPGPPLPAGDFPPPGFEDEHQILSPPRSGPLPHPLAAGPGRSPFNIGHDDLNPPGLGPHDPFRGSFVGGGLPRPGGAGGMHPTFDDPLFGGQGGDGSGLFDPQVPPGARWDPVGPGGPGGPGFPGRQGPRDGRGGPFGGGGGGGFGGFGGGII